MAGSGRDVVIVGGGPAGLAAALALARAGRAVTVLDGRRPPLDKACGEGLMPAALAALGALGIDLGGAGRAFTGIRYVAGGRAAEADFPAGGAGRGLRRTELHAVLAAAVAAAGVELRWGERAVSLTARGVATAAGELAARCVVGADGLRSKVRHWAALARPALGPQRFGVRRHLALAPTSPRVEVIFGTRAEAYVTPLGSDEVGVALLWAGAGRGFDALLAERFAPAVAERFAAAAPRSRDRGAGPFRQRVRSAAAGRVALVGDAAGYVDALTGEGLAIAFQEARALARAVAAGDLASYARASARLRRAPETITRLALTAARHPPLTARVVAALARDPALFSRLLGTLGAGAPAASVGAAATLRFALRLLAPAGAGAG